MKMKQFPLLLMILIIPGIDFARQEKSSKQTKDETEHQFHRIADIFEKNVKPYLEQFADNQFNMDKTTQEYKRLVDSYYRLYLQKAEHVRTDGLKVYFDNSKAQQPLKDKAHFITYFDFAYRTNFPGLDYKFYEQCEKDLKGL